MPFVSMTTAGLVPNIFDQFNPQNPVRWFSFIRHYSKRECFGTIAPPTKREFMKEWDSLDRSYIFASNGNTIEDSKRYTRRYSFQSYYLLSIPIEERNNKLKHVTWVRMILAFNMYAKIRQSFGLQPYHKIDFIGSIGNNHPERNKCKNWFDGKKVLFISNEKLHNLIHLTEINNTNEFWDCIFEIYDNLNINCEYNINSNLTLEQEYTNRENDELEMFTNNQQIANMIMKIRYELPKELKKNIFNTCK